MKAINQQNSETYGGGGDIMRPYKDKEEDLNSELISNDPLTLGSEMDEEFSARDQGVLIFIHK